MRQSSRRVSFLPCVCRGRAASIYRKKARHHAHRNLPTDRQPYTQSHATYAKSYEAPPILRIDTADCANMVGSDPLTGNCAMCCDALILGLDTSKRSLVATRGKMDRGATFERLDATTAPVAALGGMQSR